MRGHMPIPRSIRIPLVLLTAAALAACAGEAWRQGLGAMDLGPVIGFEPGGPHAGQTNAGTTTLSYVYQSEVQAGAPARLRLSGTLQDERRRHMEVNIYVVFLDAGGALLDKDLVLSSGPGGYGRKRDFDESLDLPAGTAAFRFGAHDPFGGRERGHR